MPPRRIPFWLKILYTAFVAVMIPYYWQTWGLQNFLYFCDVAALVTCLGIWLESPLLISLETLAILIPQIVWIIDFTAHFLAVPRMHFTDYMFDPGISLFARGLSLFHGWLPFLLLWLICRLGYDRRALRIQTTIGIAQLLICYFCFVPPGTRAAHRVAINLNYVFGISNSHPQSILPPLLWLAMLLIGVPVLMYLPAHWILLRFVSPPCGARNGEQ